jgi:tRNA (mo5U34)-methyltransferase
MASAAELIDASTFVWHQRFELEPGVWTPGVSDVELLWELGQVPADLSGLTVLDIGTTNGGTAFAAERRGASRVLAVDIFDPSWFGFDALKAHLGSKVEFLRSSIYDLPERLGGEQFDIVIFWGVLYHLRHPLLALDNVKTLTAGTAWVESAICDGALGDAASQPLCRFYRRDELNGDGSNWFSPTSRLLMDWCASCGLRPELMWNSPDRAMVRATPSAPEWPSLSYERPLQVTVSLG